MTKSLDIFDFKGKKRTVEIDMTDVTKIEIAISLCGEELLNVTYQNGTEKVIDTDGCERAINYHDGRYTVYDRTVNLIDDREWKKKKNPYSRMAYAMR